MHTTGRRRLLRGIAALAVAGTIAGGLAACAPASDDKPAGPITANGTDDGAKLTLWTRAPLERQAKLLVKAYNASHKNQVELTVVPNDDYVAKVGAAAGSGGLPDLFAADIVYVPNWVKQGLFTDITEQIDGLDYKDQINKDGTPGKYKLVKIEKPELYDLSNDPGETKNVADANPDVVKQLLALAEKAGAQVLPMTTVTSVREGDDGIWEVDTVRTGRWLRTDKSTFTTRQVILAAGHAVAAEAARPTPEALAAAIGGA